MAVRWPAMSPARAAVQRRRVIRRRCRPRRRQAKMPNRKPTSPSRVITNALTAPARAALLLPVVADQEVGADAHHLPADQQHEQVVGEDDEQHRGGEQRDERGVRRVARVALEVGGRVDLHGQRDDRRRRPTPAPPSRRAAASSRIGTAAGAAPVPSRADSSSGAVGDRARGQDQRRRPATRAVAGDRDRHDEPRPRPAAEQPDDRGQRTGASSATYTAVTASAPGRPLGQLVQLVELGASRGCGRPAARSPGRGRSRRRRW